MPLKLEGEPSARYYLNVYPALSGASIGEAR
jgi:hypothetical protein